MFFLCQEALENTYIIAKRCDVTIVFGEYKLPFSCAEPYSAYEYLELLCRKGMQKDTVL